MSFQTLRIVGASATDDIYCHDFHDGLGEITWNMTRIERDAKAGVFGKPKTWVGIPEMDKDYLLNTDRAKVERFKLRPDILKIPVIAIEGKDLGPDCLSVECFCDGNHRLVAMAELGIDTFRLFLVPRELEKSYRVEFIVS